MLVTFAVLRQPLDAALLSKRLMQWASPLASGAHAVELAVVGGSRRAAAVADGAQHAAAGRAPDLQRDQRAHGGAAAADAAQPRAAASGKVTLLAVLSRVLQLVLPVVSMKVHISVPQCTPCRRGYQSSPRACSCFHAVFADGGLLLLLQTPIVSFAAATATGASPATPLDQSTVRVLRRSAVDDAVPASTGSTAAPQPADEPALSQARFHS